MPSWLTDDSLGLTEPEAVAYSEKVSYPENGAPSGSVDLKVKWDEATEVIENILSNFHQWPYESVIPMYALNASAKPMSGVRTGADGGINTYTHAIISVNYGYVNLDDGGGEGGSDRGSFTERITPNAEMIKLKPKDKNGISIFSFGETPHQDDWLTEEDTPNKLVIGFDYNLNWSRYLGPLPIELITGLNHVHVGPTGDGSYTSPTLGLVFPAESMLLTAASISQTLSGTSLTRTLDLTYSIRPTGWNKYWRQKTNTWERIWQRYEDFSAAEYYNYPTMNLLPILV